MRLFLGQTDEAADQQRTGDNQQSTERTSSQGKEKLTRYQLNCFNLIRAIQLATLTMKETDSENKRPYLGWPWSFLTNGQTCFIKCRSIKHYDISHIFFTAK